MYVLNKTLILLLLASELYADDTHEEMYTTNPGIRLWQTIIWIHSKDICHHFMQLQICLL